ncbi:PREDICTED: uncharacterized protein LOC109132916 [Camelina sativa]|uniref:Uncharacterized protein LOC109132916 n=1 Tax=Camelina sativa TaxID=90675 RepID=A0ABM1RPI4_CAMSA|nr:PREDICTED: uncharacterized protein LOC109132916 [Camelina sativa]
MAVKETQTSRLLSLLIMLLCLSFHVRVTEARFRHIVRISTSPSRSTPPSKPCGSGIYHVDGATEASCRRPARPSAADP